MVDCYTCNGYLYALFGDNKNFLLYHEKALFQLNSNNFEELPKFEKLLYIGFQYHEFGYYEKALDLNLSTIESIKTSLIDNNP